VQHAPNRGYFVPKPDGALMRELGELRAILEMAAAGGMVRTVTDADVEQIGALARRFSELVRNGSILEQYEANLAFHARLLRLSPNRELIGVVEDLRARCTPAPLTQWRTLARIEQSAREHEQIVEALAARDAERLRKVIRAHILQTETAEASAHDHSELSLLV
jgi:DNA-binding GntR family transcriptional regulator